MNKLFVGLMLLSGCESGLALSVRLTIPTEILSRFSSGAPGLVMTDQGGNTAPYEVLCGQAISNPLVLSQDRGFGCLGDLKDRQETVNAWIEPLPTGWDAAGTCAARSPSERSFDVALFISPPDGGVALANSPDPSWPRGTAVGTWARDLSPCGGELNTVITLSVP